MLIRVGGSENCKQAALNGKSISKEREPSAVQSRLRVSQFSNENKTASMPRALLRVTETDAHAFLNLWTFLEHKLRAEWETESM